MPSAAIPWDLTGDLERRAGEGARRRRLCLHSPQGAMVESGDQRLVNFSSNDYLGLASDPRMVAALQAAAGRWGVGSGASQLVTGHSEAHRRLEEALAEFTGRPRALVFSTGYLANMGVLTALAGRRDVILQDRLCHASLVDGARLSGARLVRYRHRDPDHLRHLLHRPGAETARRTLVVTDGLFSMDGDLAPLDRLLPLAEEAGAVLMLDDAHGLGALGEEGGGTEEVLGMRGRVPLLIGTLGKAFGSFGAFVAGEEALMETLIQGARPYIYTTALPPALAEAAGEAVAIAREETWRRQHLARLTRRFVAGARTLGLPVLPSEGPIQGLSVPGNREVVAASERLAALGFLVVPIRAPTVPRGAERLRITLTAAHSEDQVDALLEALEGVSP